MKTRSGTTLIEMLILLVAFSIFLVAVYQGFHVVIKALNYSEEVVYKMYARKQLDISMEIINSELKNAGSMGPVINSLNNFFTEGTTEFGEEAAGSDKRGIFAFNDNIFTVQYCVTETLSLKHKRDGATETTYRKIVQDALPLSTSERNGSSVFPIIRTKENYSDSFTDNLTVSSITEESATLVNIKNSALPSNPADNANRIFFSYLPKDLNKPIKISEENHYGEKISRTTFIFGSDTDEASVLKMVKYYPYIDKSATTVLLNNLKDFSVKFGYYATSDKTIKYEKAGEMETYNYWDDLKTIKISVEIFIPNVKKNEETEDYYLQASRVFWLPGEMK